MVAESEMELLVGTDYIAARAALRHTAVCAEDFMRGPYHIGTIPLEVAQDMVEICVVGQACRAIFGPFATCLEGYSNDVFENAYLQRIWPA